MCMAHKPHQTDATRAPMLSHASFCCCWSKHVCTKENADHLFWIVMDKAKQLIVSPRPGAPHHPGQLLKPPMKKAAVKKAAAKKPQRETWLPTPRRADAGRNSQLEQWRGRKAGPSRLGRRPGSATCRAECAAPCHYVPCGGSEPWTPTYKKASRGRHALQEKPKLVLHTFVPVSYTHLTLPTNQCV